MKPLVAAVLIAAISPLWSLGATPIPQEFKKSAVYILLSKGDVRPRGTGFVVGVKVPGFRKIVMYYLVTARHVLTDSQGRLLNDIWVRYKLRKGGTVDIPVPLAKASKVYFHPHEETVDLAVIPVVLNSNNLDFLFIDETQIVTTADLREPWLGEGAEVFFVSMFHFFHPEQPYLPIVRFGRLASVPDARLPSIISGRITERMELMLVEERAYLGSSGSPVYIYIGPFGTPGRFSLKATIKLLGVVHGYYSEGVQVKNPTSDSLTQSYAEVNSGLAAVIPAYRLLEILYCEPLVAERKLAASVLAQLISSLMYPAFAGT